jgi:hypothetical protein
MRKIILFLLLSASYYNAFSQQDSLLKKFKYRIDHYRAINLNANGGSNFNKTELVPGKYKAHSSSGGAGVSLYTVKSTDKILLTTSGSILSNFSFNKSENTSNTQKNRSFSAATQFSILNKWFSKKLFTELGADISGNNYANKNTSSAVTAISKNKQIGYSLALNTGIGKGRLENITDMQNALWLNKALTEADRLSKSLTADELYELGRSITKASNTRILDSRKRTQFMLETVDTYLQSKGLISKNDIAYFSNLNDILFFAFNNTRLAGSEKFIRFTPSISGAHNNSIQSNPVDKYEQTPILKSALLSIGLSNYKPVSLKHQNNYGASVKLNYLSYTSTDKYFNAGILVSEFNYETKIKQAGVNLFYQHSFYPNTRTVVNINLQTEAGYQDVEQEEDFYGAANLSGNFNYFISYRTRLSIDVGAAYRKNIYDFNYRNLKLFPDDIQLFVNAGIGISL